ncbi:hypothetical protein Salat_1251000 [Sesamum alatum]|uniref:Uncharacterized protein n=1 Tax=Sesamum alatum TaxID=300844 RepID=A0AAE1YG31_9LAMI|nr:hypothetical protein Salat_1251000 [Sesamum alatum]
MGTTLFPLKIVPSSTFPDATARVHCSMLSKLVIIRSYVAISYSLSTLTSNRALLNDHITDSYDPLHSSRTPFTWVDPLNFFFTYLSVFVAFEIPDFMIPMDRSEKFVAVAI